MHYVHIDCKHGKDHMARVAHFYIFNVYIICKLYISYKKITTVNWPRIFNLKLELNRIRGSTHAKIQFLRDCNVHLRQESLDGDFEVSFLE